MYFPFLRGKQYELIALREIDNILRENSSRVSPIIEPVKDSTTLKKTLADLAKSNVNFNIVVNPTVGDLTKDSEKIINLIKTAIPQQYNDYQIAIIAEEQTPYAQLLDSIIKSNLSFSGFSFIHNAPVPTISEIIGKYETFRPVVNNIVNFTKTNRRYHRNFASHTKVSLDDYFKAQSKNSDYLANQDESFSEEHLHFREDGFKGFSDYLTIGEGFSDSGFAPYAVAIHLSYINEDNEIRIRHFVSDSNDDWTDVAGKFAEALSKLIAWEHLHPINTIAIREFKELHQTGHFPGLGTIKKISIKNHLQLTLSVF